MKYVLACSFFENIGMKKEQAEYRQKGGDK